MGKKKKAIEVKEAKIIEEEPKEKKKNYRKFKCRQCGSRMVQIEDTNTMACENCNQYFVFSKQD